jgi:hypothetical protein
MSDDYTNRAISEKKAGFFRVKNGCSGCACLALRRQPDFRGRRRERVTGDIPEIL